MIQITLTENPIEPSSVLSKVRQDTNGAVVTFLGTVRSPSQGKEVLFLEYEAYREMAEAKLWQIGGEIKARWQIKDIALCHRIGKVRVGEVALALAIASPHRSEAFAACQYAVDRLKQIVPIWKKEIYANGENWVER